MEKQRREESKRGGEQERRSERRKSEKKEDAGAQKGRKVTIHCVFPMIYGSGGSKSNLAKAAGAEPAGQMKDEKVHAAVARRCAKHISKSKVSTTHGLRPLLEVEMSEKCTPSSREAHFQVKMFKTRHVRTTFGS